MKKCLLFILVCNMAIFTHSYAATVSWDGGASTSSWTDAMNWDTDALPTTNDDVVIDGAVVVLTGSQQVQRVEVKGGGELTIAAAATLTIDGYAANDDGFDTTDSAIIINNGTISISNINGGTGADGFYSRGTFTNNGLLEISNTARHGLYVVDGLFTNSGTGSITVTDVGLMDTNADYIYVDDSNSGTKFGTLTNDGSITVTMTSADDAIYVKDGAILNNNAMISVLGLGKNGVRVEDDATYNNNLGATTSVDGGTDDQLLVDDLGASFINAGTVNLTNADAGDAALYVIDSGIFTNETTGIVNITGALQNGILVDANGGAAEIVNNGTITITSSSSDAVRLQENGTLTNNTDGTLNIISAGDEGIQIDDPGTLNNSGDISITNNTDHGMEMVGGIFNNMSGASFVIATTSDKGIVMQIGTTINNSGTIDISATANEGTDMIGGIFNNMAGGMYIATNCSDDGLEVNAATVNNDGGIRIDGSGSEDIETFAGAVINNSATATYAPGSSPGDLEIKGDYDLGSSVTTFEMTGPTPITEYDQILNYSSGNTITISSATAHLDWGTYVPSVGATFKLIDGSGQVAGTFSAITSSNPNIVIDTDYAANAAEVLIEVTASAALPVELTSFNGIVTNEGNLLAWQTASELNNKGFEIERSTNTENWETISFVEGNGTSLVRNDYKYLDEVEISNITYYRLKQIDIDGSFEYSETIALQKEKDLSPSKIYPNPANNKLTYEGDEATLIFYDAYGNKIKQLHTRQTTEAIDINEFSSGAYILEIIKNGDSKEFIKFIKR